MKPANESVQSRTVLALDPGYDRLGWAVAKLSSRSITLLKFGLIQTQKSETIWERYTQIDRELTAIVSEYQPSELAIETLLFSKNTRTALQVSEARGLIFSVAVRHGLRISQYNPMTIKLAVAGTGRADKKAVEKMVRLQLNLPAQKLIDDTLDALAVMITHAAIGGE